MESGIKADGLAATNQFDSASPLWGFLRVCLPFFFEVLIFPAMVSELEKATGPSCTINPSSFYGSATAVALARWRPSSLGSGTTDLVIAWAILAALMWTIHACVRAIWRLLTRQVTTAIFQDLWRNIVNTFRRLATEGIETAESLLFYFKGQVLQLEDYSELDNDHLLQDILGRHHQVLALFFKPNSRTRYSFLLGLRAEENYGQTFAIDCPVKYYVQRVKNDNWRTADEAVGWFFEHGILPTYFPGPLPILSVNGCGFKYKHREAWEKAEARMASRG